MEPEDFKKSREPWEPRLGLSPAWMQQDDENWKNECEGRVSYTTFAEGQVLEGIVEALTTRQVRTPDSSLPAPSCTSSFVRRRACD